MPILAYNRRFTFVSDADIFTATVAIYVKCRFPIGRQVYLDNPSSHFDTSVLAHCGRHDGLAAFLNFGVRMDDGGKAVGLLLVRGCREVPMVGILLKVSVGIGFQPIVGRCKELVGQVGDEFARRKR